MSEPREPHDDGVEPEGDFDDVFGIDSLIGGGEEADAAYADEPATDRGGDGEPAGASAAERAAQLRAEEHRDPAAIAELARVQAALQARAGEAQPELRLDSTRQACELLGDIHESAPVITVTGTNGKTSTVRMVDALLGAHDLRVGRFSSPHLHRLSERISVDGAEVSAFALGRVWDEIAPFLDLVDGQLAAEDRAPLTYFEALTVLAFAVFADAPVDVMVLEVGMGGEWDSTNVADAAICGFTPIGLDHQAFLGDTLEQIAATKAGILDRTLDPSPAPHPVAVVGEQPEAAAGVLAEQIAQRGDEALWEGEQFGVVERSRAVDGQLLNLRGAFAQYPEIFLPLHGAHQAQNAAQALAIVECFLAAEDKPLDADVVGAGFAQVTSPGRMEIMRTEPTIIVDGAHNPAGAQALAEALDEAFDFPDVVAVVAVYADKDPHGMLEYVHRFASRIVVTQALSPRAMPVDRLAAAAEEWYDPDDVHRAPDMNAALMAAIDLVVGTEDTGAGIVVTGSLATVAEARTLLGSQEA